MTVYIEYVLIDNFAIDFFLLKATFSLTRKRVPRWRLLLCAVLGAGIALVFPLVQVHTVILSLIKTAAGFLIILLAAEYSSFKDFYVNAALFLGLTFALGGAITGIYSLLGVDPSSEFSIAAMALPAYVLLKAVTATVKYIYRRKDIISAVYEIEMTVNGVAVKANGFFDTGNALYDGDSPVIVCGKKFAEKFIKDSIPKIKHIYYGTVSGRDRMLAFKIDNLKIYIGDKPNIFNNVTLGVAKKNVGTGYDVILHPALAEAVYENESIGKTEKVS